MVDVDRVFQLRCLVRNVYLLISHFFYLVLGCIMMIMVFCS
jgi:hypothetical protein